MTSDIEDNAFTRDVRELIDIAIDDRISTDWISKYRILAERRYKDNLEAKLQHEVRISSIIGSTFGISKRFADKLRSVLSSCGGDDEKRVLVFECIELILRKYNSRSILRKEKENKLNEKNDLLATLMEKTVKYFTDADSNSG